VTRNDDNGVRSSYSFLKGRNGNILNIILVGAGGLGASNIYFVGNSGGGGGGDAGPAHDCGRRIDILNGKGTEISIVDEVSCIDIGALNVVAEAITGIVVPDGSVSLSTSRGQIA